jgi:type IV secretion system protein VirB6
LVIPAITTGNILLAQAAFAYPLFVISVAAYMVNAFIVCMITITILGMLSPIFVPMALFNYTKGYFDSWLKLMISFVLQPIIVAGFMVLMFAVYDSTFYDSCKYKTYVVNSNKKTYVAGSGENISSANHLFFSIDTDKNNYKIEEFDQCTQSFGYLLNGALAVYLQITNPEIAITAVTGPGHFNQMADFVTSVAGLFTDSHGLTLNKVMNLLLYEIMICWI